MNALFGNGMGENSRFLQGVALLVLGGVLLVLKWVLPALVPLAVGGYGLFLLYSKRHWEGGVALGLGVVLWFLRGLVGGLILVGALVCLAGGAYFLFQSFKKV